MWSVQQVARAAGTTSRTLRHYDDIGLLPPTRVGSNGYRYYDEDALVRLQRILLLRELGLPLSTIAEVLDGERDAAAALRTHLDLLVQERERLDRRIASVRTTLEKREGGRALMAEEMFDGFDHTRYRDEVVQRWGRDAWESGDRWWRSMSEADQAAFQREQAEIAAEYGAAHAAGMPVDGDEVQEITRRHHAWVSAGWQGRCPSAEAFTGLGAMYVDDPRFAAHYDRHGEGTAAYVRDAMAAYAQRNL
ncbi:MerR family transcriptional regulator [Pseudonocardia sp.]|uniref:MerR family transcriptional regulator n=1 Tax=Pseudonocardia sp. TaxID=60912 RepID=UPI003D0E38A3